MEVEGFERGMSEIWDPFSCFHVTSCLGSG